MTEFRALSKGGIVVLLLAMLSLFTLPFSDHIGVQRADAAAFIRQSTTRVSATAGETLTEGDAAVIKSDGKAYKADADDSTLRPSIGIVHKGAAANASAEIVTRGILGGLSSLTTGAPVYLSTTAGGRTQTLPAAYGQQLGIAISATEMTIDVGTPDNTIATGTVTPAKRSLAMRNETGGALAAGDLVYVSSWSETQTRFLVSKADADAAGARATYVMQASLANNTNGTAYKTYRLTAQNTNGSTVGDAIYLSTTAGGWTASAPTGGDDINQIVGRVAVVSATVGEIELDLDSNNTPVSAGTNELQALAVTTAKLAANAVTAAKVTSTMATGFINVPLESLREILTNDIGNAATAAATGSGGILAKDTTPILERINGATDKALRVAWAAGNADAVTFSIAYPPDLDDTAAITVNILAKMAGATDTPAITVAYFEGVGDTDAGGATGALSTTLAKVSRTIAAGDVGAYPNAATVSLTPGTHGTDALHVHAIWIEYTRK